ncbi:MAG: hypothetical protein AAF845_08705 [Bacteroidota bacterium]
MRIATSPLRALLLAGCAISLAGCSEVSQLARDTISDVSGRPLPATDDTPRAYETSQGESIQFALGAVAFADRADRFAPTQDLNDAYLDPWQAVGPPDYETGCRDGDECYVSLTPGGVAVFEFTNNTLFDGPGNDIVVFEIGPDVEATTVEISVDGRDYVSLGRVEGSSAALDIGGRGRSGAQYRFVRLTDVADQGGTSGSTPGADIDAVGAIHAERR